MLIIARTMTDVVHLCYVLQICALYRVAQKTKPLPNDQKIELNRIKACQ